MRRMPKYRPSPAMAMALVALFIALGGVGYATSQHHHSQPATVRAYGLVQPPRPGFGRLRRGFTPLVRELSKNVTLGSPRPSAPEGTWCFLLAPGIDPSTATVVVSAEGGTKRLPSGSLREPDSAEWVANARDCPPHEIEVQTIGHTAERTVTYSNSTSFSFVAFN